MSSTAVDVVPPFEGGDSLAGPRNRAEGRAVAHPKESRPAKAPRMRRGRRESFLGALLRPIGVSIGLILMAYGALSLGTTYWRSYQRHVEHTAPVHADSSRLEIAQQPALPADALELVVRDVDGTIRHVVAGKSETDAFVNDTILMLDSERDRIKAAAAGDIDRQFEFAFADRDQAIDAYADWFFDWKRSYVVLKESLTAAANRFLQAGQYESLSEAVERDVREYFMRHYADQVLKPSLRDEKIGVGIEFAVREAHDSYRRVIANGDMRLQLFLASHTRHLVDVPADTAMTKVALDWDAQKWKAPTYLMEDKAFEGVVGMGGAAAGGTIGALVLGPAINRSMATAFGALSRRFVASFGSRLAFAEGGAVAGTMVQPVGGQVVGAVAGVLVGLAADYFINRAHEEFNRDKFVAANNEALDATIDGWKTMLKANVNAAIDRWFDDARASVILAQK